MLREAVNKVKIEGILSEIDLKYGSYEKVINGAKQKVDTIGGLIKVLVNQTVNGEEQHLEIPVHMFSNRLTKKGTLNPAYTSIETVMKEYTSIASAGGEAGADKIRITGAQIRMNEYYNQNHQLVSFPRITTSFVSRATGEFKPCATFELEFALAQMNRAVDKDGIETDPAQLNIKAIVPMFGGNVQVVPLIATNPNVIDAVENYWEKNGSYKANGRLNFTATTKTERKEVDFGEPIETTRTITVSDLVITGGSQAPLDDTTAFAVKDLKEALAKRTEYLEGLKTKNVSKKAPAPASNDDLDIASAGEDLGF